MAQPDEGGTIVVHSATQSLDTVQRAVAHALGVTVNKVGCKTSPDMRMFLRPEVALGLRARILRALYRHRRE